MKTYEEYVKQMKKIASFNSTAGLLQWDQEVNMPEKGSQFRAQQISHLSTLIHDYETDEELGKYLRKAVDDSSLSEDQSINVKRSLEDYKKEEKIPASLVEKLSIARSNAFQAWVKSRRENDFEIFAPHLKKIVKLQREYADCLREDGERYEALLDLYEPGMKVEKVKEVFETLIPGIHNILDKIDDNEFQSHLPKGNFPKQKQLELGEKICRSLGYDFQAGRQDISEHPFTLGIHPTDTRITSRIDENSLSYMLWSTIHECGHALYEQGLKADFHGLPLGEAASLSIHESQSRLYENNLGRSKVFINSWFKDIKGTFAKAMEGMDVEKYYDAINRIEPTLIRTESDELHYHFHIYIRFIIERALINGDIEVDEVVEKWNSLYKKHLGVEVPDDKSGVLQDVHWSHGSMGYFPTYTLGSLYAAQFMKAAENQLPDLKNSLEKKDYSVLLDWLRNHIHTEGRKMKSEELCRSICGETLNPDHFLMYAEKKYVY